MRNLFGVIDGNLYEVSALKQQVLLFDKLHLLHCDRLYNKTPQREEVRATLDFLQRNAVVVEVPDVHVQSVIKGLESNEMARFRSGLAPMESRGSLAGARAELFWQYLPDIELRQYASVIEKEQNGDVVPVCGNRLPDYLRDASATLNEHHRVLYVGLASLPVPDEASSWEDVLDFRASLHDKRWGFRRFLRGMATKRQSPSEIQDEIDWLVNEYANAMKLRNIRAGESFVEVYVIPVLEIIEDLAKVNWSKLAKGALSINKRDVDLMEAEMKAPGRECAYIFDARKRFARSASFPGK